MDNFVVGENRELVAFLRSPKAGFRGVWISGPGSSGRTHLLQAHCRAVLQSGRQAVYLENGMITSNKYITIKITSPKKIKRLKFFLKLISLKLDIYITLFDQIY